MELHQYEKLLLSALKGSSGEISLHELAKKASLSEDAAIKAAMWLSEKGLANVNSTAVSKILLTDEGKKYAKEGFPEASVAKKAAGSPVPISSLTDSERGIGIPWAKKKGWIDISGGKVSLTPKGQAAAIHYPSELADECKKILDGKAAGNETEKEFVSRGLAKLEEKKSHSIKLTQKGEKAAMEIGEIGEEINQLTREMLISGGWKGKHLRQYNIDAPVEDALPGKRHIISALDGKISRIFLEMGFEEMKGGMIESSFWNFDALFQPQDHPARDLADTFYLEGDFPLPDPALVSRVKKSHERGWKCKWRESEAKKAVLRTHTTAVSAKTLLAGAANPAGKKYFCIGKVFRNEATDYKHLAEFFQVEGIVSWEGATFSHLLGFLSEFYRKLGFEKIRFRPSYFPYTEPSLEVHVWYEPKKTWMELGGAGIFRPEVSVPLCGKYPVLAWGLSLERPLMMLLGIEDIRSFYKNNAGFLRSSKMPADFRR